MKAVNFTKKENKIDKDFFLPHTTVYSEFILVSISSKLSKSHTTYSCYM